MAALIKELTAERAVQLLIDGPEPYRLEVIKRLYEQTINSEKLRKSIKEQIHQNYDVGREDEDRRGIGIYWVRSWLISTLARLKDNDPDTEALVIKHLDFNYEKQEWVRHWTLEALIDIEHPQLLDIASRLAREDNNELVIKLAQAILARNNDAEAHNAIVAGLKVAETGLQWAALRALRIVWLPTTAVTNEVLTLLERTWNFDLQNDQSLVYDAIIAAAQIPSTQTRYREDAANFIATKVWENRYRPVYDGIRLKALDTLGKLKVESTATRLLECLNDGNPAIVRESIRALEQVLTLPIAISRVIELATHQDAGQLEELSRALAWLDRNQVAEELESVLSSNNPVQQNIARELLRSIGGSAAYQKLSATRDIIEKFKGYSDWLTASDKRVQHLYDDNIRGARTGFNITLIMSVCLFIGGIVFIVLAVYVLLSRPDLMNTFGGTAITAGTGFVGVIQTILSAFLVQSNSQVDTAVEKLSYRQAILQGFFRVLQYSDQFYMRRIIEETVMTAAEYKVYLDMTTKAIDDVTKQLTQAGVTNIPPITPPAIVQPDVSKSGG